MYVLFEYKDRLDMSQTLSIEKRVVENINMIKHKIHSWWAGIRYRTGGRKTTLRADCLHTQLHCLATWTSCQPRCPHSSSVKHRERIGGWVRAVPATYCLSLSNSIL